MKNNGNLLIVNGGLVRHNLFHKMFSSKEPKAFIKSTKPGLVLTIFHSQVNINIGA